MDGGPANVLIMSDGVDDVCGLAEVIETEQVVEIMEESQFLDLAASMETGGETVSPAHEMSIIETTTDTTQLPGQKRKRGYKVSQSVVCVSQLLLLW